MSVINFTIIIIVSLNADFFNKLITQTKLIVLLLIDYYLYYRRSTDIWCTVRRCYR